MTVRWGIIGCGDVVRKRVAEAIQQERRSELTMVCRRDRDELNRFCKDFQVPRGVTDARELIESSDVDAVYIATPVDLHKPQTIHAAEAGKHVLVEKPMGLTTADCDEMIAVCAANHVQLGVAFYRPFYPVIQRMQHLAGSGAIGTVLSVSAVTSTPFDMQPGDDGYWRVIPEQGGGGALMDIGSHRLELFLRMFGPIVDVRGLVGTLAADYQADNVASLILRFESGVHGILQCYFGTSVDPDEFAVLGTKARLLSRPLNQGELVIDSGGDQVVEQHPPAANLSQPLIADFVSAIEENRDPLVTGLQGRQVNRLMEIAYADSTAEGRTVD